MIVHVTSEMKKFKIGGIATICDVLYDNRNENEKFYLTLKQHVDMQMKDIKVIDLKYLRKDKFKDVNKIIFHNFLLANEYLIGGKRSPRLFYVMHSNVVLESLLGGAFSDEDVKKFKNVISNMNIVLISNYELTVLTKTLEILDIKDFDYNKVTVIYNGIKFNDNQIYKYSDYNRVGYLGRLDKRKGIIESVRQLANTRCNYIIAGGGKGLFNEAVIESLAPIVNSCSNVMFLGYCNAKRKERFFESIDALIIPSTYEPFGMTVLEALNEGILPIVNNIEPFKEILGEDYPFTFDINVNQDILFTLDKFYTTSEEERTLLYNSVLKRVKENFNSKLMIERYRNL